MSKLSTVATPHTKLLSQQIKRLFHSTRGQNKEPPVLSFSFLKFPFLTFVIHCNENRTAMKVCNIYFTHTISRILESICNGYFINNLSKLSYFITQLTISKLISTLLKKFLNKCFLIFSFNFRKLKQPLR